ncbi:MAG: LytTR family transcriptional regulator DNA-binding domain-containing protein [Arcicella sp.]|nr:LytTR family transcriptional regulator DNA-binding domain-containing protein [Arcicella sp.]
MINPAQNTRFFLLPNKHKRKDKIPFDDILYLQGNINYTLIHLHNGKIKLSPRTLLYHIQHSLNDSFIRIHRAYIVNKKHIKDTEISDIKHVRHLFLKDGTQLSVSRRKRNNLNEL